MGYSPDYWVVNRDGKLLVRINKDAALVPAVKEDELGRPTFASFSVKELETVVYYYNDMNRTKIVRMYSKEELQWNTLNVYLTPYDTSQPDPNKIIVQSNGMLYEIKDGQMLPYVK